MGTSSSKESEHPKSDLDLFLIGKTGHGKSSAGNTILGSTTFKVGDSGTPATINIMSGCARTSLCIVKVIDGPGPMDAMLKGRALLEHTSKLLSKSFVECPHGFHALLLVLKYGQRYTEEEKNTVEMLRAMLGKNVIKDHCILIFTHGESFEQNNAKVGKTFFAWCTEQKFELGDLIKECSNRVVLFYNKTQQKREETLQQLYSHVKKIPSRYTHGMFQNIYLERQKFIRKYGAIHLQDNIQSQIRIIINMLESEYGELKESELRSELDNLEKIINKERSDLKATKSVKTGIEQARKRNYTEAKKTFTDIEYEGMDFFPELLDNVSTILRGILMKIIH